MRTEPNAETDQAIGVVPEIVPTSKWRIREVRACRDFGLWLRFNDGTQGEIDLTEFLRSPRAGVFSTLLDKEIFSQVRLERGALVWPGGLDIAPDALYREIRERT